MQTFLIVFVATLLSLHVALIDSKYSDSSVETYYSYDQRQQISLPGVGVVTQPILQAVTVQHPNYGSDSSISRLLSQVAAQRDASSKALRDDKSEEDDDEDEDSKEDSDSDDDERKSKNDDSDSNDDDSVESDSRVLKDTRDIKTGNNPLCILFAGYGPGKF